jgi:hypothetical protein
MYGIKIYYTIIKSSAEMAEIRLKMVEYTLFKFDRRFW